MAGRPKLALVAVAVAAAAAAAAWALVPATRFAYGVAPIAAGEAILLTRRNEDRATHFWVQLVRRDGKLAWSTETSPVRTEEALGFSGVAASSDRIVLLGEREHRTVVMGLDRTTGSRSWETDVRDGEPSVIGPMLIADGPRVYAVTEHEQHTTITALALADGAVQWTFDPATQLGDTSLLQVVLLGADRLALTSTRGEPGIVLDGAGGTVLAPLPMQRIGCETPDALIGFDHDVVVRLPRSAEATAQRVSLDKDARVTEDGPCGDRDGETIVATGGPAGSALVRIDAAAGIVRWRVPLGEGRLVRPATVDGRLPQLVPIVQHGVDGPQQRTVVVDLDRGAIVAEHAHEEQRMAFMTGERAFAISMFRPAVFAFDPERGAVERTTLLTSANTDEVRTQDIRFGELWVYGSGWGPPTELAWAVVDLATATVAAKSGDLVVSDAAP